MADIALVFAAVKLVQDYRRDPMSFSLRKQLTEQFYVETEDDNGSRISIAKVVGAVIGLVLLVASVVGYWHMIRCENPTNTAYGIVILIFLFAWLPGVSTLVGAGYWLTYQGKCPTRS